MTSPNRLAEIAARLAKATKSQKHGDYSWQSIPDGPKHDAADGPHTIFISDLAYVEIATGASNHDADFIAHAPTDLAYLLARLKAAERRLTHRDEHVAADDALRLHLEERLRAAEAVAEALKQAIAVTDCYMPCASQFPMHDERHTSCNCWRSRGRVVLTAWQQTREAG